MKVVFGIVLITSGIWLFLEEGKRYKALRKDQYLQKSFFTESFVLASTLIIIGFGFIIKGLISIFD
ncbi:hypothetical protein EAX61_03140 [Dokdonia sinensis]|uniref:Molybdenum ABC transporter permease n=1 Tax=Dokdonia sinensis TaxID=2479847 RepID=A0A3M0GE05_9FLAO|nr:hypothetical protein EAX61_03140 [Dokdonia sinensis]